LTYRDAFCCSARKPKIKWRKRENITWKVDMKKQVQTYKRVYDISGEEKDFESVSWYDVNKK
jgi:hypothetical protein